MLDAFIVKDLLSLRCTKFYDLMIFRLEVYDRQYPPTVWGEAWLGRIIADHNKKQRKPFEYSFL